MQDAYLDRFFILSRRASKWTDSTVTCCAPHAKCSHHMNHIFQILVGRNEWWPHKDCCLRLVRLVQQTPVSVCIKPSAMLAISSTFRPMIDHSHFATAAVYKELKAVKYFAEYQLSSIAGFIQYMQLGDDGEISRYAGAVTSESSRRWTEYYSGRTCTSSLTLGHGY